MKSKSIVASCGVITALTVSMCTYDSKEPDESTVCDTLEISFAAQVAPLIQNNCAINGCHSGTQFPTLISYSGIKENAALIRFQVSSRRMPLNSALAQNEINNIVCWIDKGAPDN